MFGDLAEFYEWFSERYENNEYRVTAAALDSMEGWNIDSGTGTIAHRSGKFFSITGIEVDTDHRETASWSQPIIVQPEIGILGIIVKVVGDALYCLMHAKMEPGNINLLQLSPTVQATRSNYMRVHRGNAVPYLEHFVAPRSGRTVFDSLQSEQGSWFLDKRNRNMIVEVTEDVPVHEDFCWLRLEQIATLLGAPNVVNMDARTVLSGLPFVLANVQTCPMEGMNRLVRANGEPLHSLDHLLSWFTEVKARYRLDRRLRPLYDLPHWVHAEGRISHEEGKHFSVIGVNVQASNREVAQWSQPMLQPAGRGVIVFLGREFGGAFHVLVHARTEAGTNDVVEMSPTVACIPLNYVDAPERHRPRYLDIVERTSSNILIDVVHSEEGGRFYHAENRYLVIDVGEDFPADVPDDYCWMTVNQLTSFVRYGNHVNVAARCLLSCLVEESVGNAFVVA